MLFNIAANIIQNIVMIDLQGPRLKEDLRQLTLDNFSWNSIAERYISFYKKLCLSGVDKFLICLYHLHGP